MSQKKAYQLDENSEGLVFGEGDVKKQHPFPKGWMGRVVVKQSQVVKMPSGVIQEDAGSIKLMNYETEVYEKLIRTEGFGEFKIEVLHDPR